MIVIDWLRYQNNITLNAQVFALAIGLVASYDLLWGPVSGQEELMKTNTICWLTTMSAIIFLAGCGGGGSGASSSGGAPAAVAFADPTSTQTDQLRSISFDATAKTVQTFVGEINRSADTATIAGQTGSINDQRTEVVIASGGLVMLSPEFDRFAIRFTADPTTGNRMIGIVGAQTPIAAVPTGTISYSGDAQLSVQSGTDLYTLTGDVIIVGNFGDGLVDTTIDNLSGTVTDGISNPTAVADVAEIQITGSALSGAAFSGGSASVSSSDFSVGSTATVALEGAIFGPSATEAGSVIIIDDTVDGGVVIFGDMLAQQ